jgi:hypothetical protein
MMVAGAAVNIPWWYQDAKGEKYLSGSVRRYHISMQKEAWEKDPELLGLIREAGVTDIWMASFIQGRWFHTPEELKQAADFLKTEGFNSHVLTVPLGHPGNAIDPNDPSLSELKKGWKNACAYDGTIYSGTSIHEPVTRDNVAALKELASAGFEKLFLDDDFRLARTPGQIGGCFCDNCKNDFLNKYGLSGGDWSELLNAVKERKPVKVLRLWTEYNCNKEYEMFRAMQNATPEMQIGIMVMYFGSEKAGIALDKYRDSLFRVGEEHFNDQSFGTVKGKTDELFSSLFHMRFARPELAFSETTSYPAAALSAKNIAAKLNVSLLSDVRNTMFMSGLPPLPSDRWPVLAPAMKKNAELHKVIAGHKKQGPFKHFYGMDSRLVGRDRPYSLFLASGIPFEVTDDVTEDGWLFLSDEDAAAVAEGRLVAKNKNLVVRKSSGLSNENFIPVEENLNEIFALKRKIIPELKDIPFVEGDVPVVFAWYPSAKKALLWNVNEKGVTYRVRRNNRILKKVFVNALDVEMITIK